MHLVSNLVDHEYSSHTPNPELSQKVHIHNHKGIGPISPSIVWYFGGLIPPIVVYALGHSPSQYLSLKGPY